MHLKETALRKMRNRIPLPETDRGIQIILKKEQLLFLLVFPVTAKGPAMETVLSPDDIVDL